MSELLKMLKKNTYESIHSFI